MRLALPEELTLETLASYDIPEYKIARISAELLEFVDKTSVVIAGETFFIDTEGLKELGYFVGISPQYLNKLPDDLFAYTMNYFYRRATGTNIELIVDDDTIMGVQLEGSLRLSLGLILELIETAYGDTPLFTEFTRKNGNYTITIVKDKHSIAGDQYYDAVTIHLNDRLYANPSYSMSVYRWGPMIKVNRYLESSLGKNIELDKALEQIREDIAFTLENANDVISHAMEIASTTLIEDPYKTVSKVFAEHGLRKHAEKLISYTTIEHTPRNCWSAAKTVSNLAFNDHLTARQQKKAEDISGHILTRLPKDHRCELCLSYVED